MKITYRMIPATTLAADSNLEALRRTLESGNLEANEDGTVSVKPPKASKPTIAENKANAAKKKGGDIPGGVLGSDSTRSNPGESLRDILARAEDPEPGAAAPAEKKPDPDQKQKNVIPKGVLGAEVSAKPAVSPEVAALLNEYRAEEAPAAPAAKEKDDKKKGGDIPGGVLGVTSK